MTSADYCKSAIQRYSWGVYLVTRLAAKSCQDELRAVLAFWITTNQALGTAPNKSVAKKRLDKLMQLVKSRSNNRQSFWPAVYRAVDKYHIPPGYLQQFLAELSTQLDFRQPADYRQLYQSCYRNGGLATQMIAQILGLSDSKSLKAAERLGVAFCLTRIINHIYSDIGKGRVRVPVSLLNEAGITAKELTLYPLSPKAHLVLSRLAAQAEAYYLAAEQGLDNLPEANRRVAKIAVEAGQSVLADLEKQNFAAIRPVRLSLLRQAIIVLKALIKPS